MSRKLLKKFDYFNRTTSGELQFVECIDAFSLEDAYYRVMAKLLPDADPASVVLQTEDPF